MSESNSKEYYELLVDDIAALQQRVDTIEDQLTALERPDEQALGAALDQEDSHRC
ncbi:MAG: hypothetical protein J07HX5_01587 [halophilic archaeon J07HX5]|jgi:hypothetical protein|nr:MAG: hypothetical protein J07HX5_01587 [halophilic archaeon J07HX5]